MHSSINEFRSLSPGEVQKIGQTRYRDKNYDAALRAFNTAIASYDPVPVELYDNRAATYEKLGERTKALRDAKHMIQLDKSDAKGYLRTGKILRLVGQDRVAVGIYEYGLRNVLTSDPHHKLLQGMLDKLSDLAGNDTNTTYRDPLVVLPTELAYMVFGQIGFYGLMSGLRVSKRWNACLESMTPVWTELDLTRPRKPVRQKALQACLRRANGGIRRAMLGSLPSIGEHVLQQVTTSCKKLECLEIRDCVLGNTLTTAAPQARNLTTLIIRGESQITLGTVAFILSTCPTLVRGEFFSIISSGVVAKWPNDLGRMRHLALVGRAAPPPQTTAVLNLDNLIERAPHLQSLTVAQWMRDIFIYEVPDFRPLYQLEKLDLHHTKFRLFPPLPTSLRWLNVTGMSGLGPNSTIMPLPDMETLLLSECTRLDLPTLEKFLEAGVGKLRNLSLQNCSSLGDVDLLILLGRGWLDGLRELNVEGLLVRDECVEAMLPKMPHLRRINLSLTPITGISLKAIAVKKNSQVRWVNVDDCKQVGLDAVEMLRDKGVRVEFLHTHFSSTSERRIRREAFYV